jgi:hypothetical protein
MHNATRELVKRNCKTMAGGGETVECKQWHKVNKSSANNQTSIWFNFSNIIWCKIV